MPTIVVVPDEVKKLSLELRNYPRLLHQATAAAMNRTLTFIGA